MAHFAQLDENNVVQQVIVIANEDCGDGEFPSSEVIGQEFISRLGLGENWKQTSYNNNFRKRYAGIGFTYDETNDVFLSPKPFNSWILNAEFEWEAPVPQPDDDNVWLWNEETLSWEAQPTAE